MKRMLILTSALVAVAATAQAQDKQVDLLSWGGAYGNSHVEAYAKPFEAKTGIKVVYDVYDSNEILETKLLAGGTGYDVVVPTNTFLQRQINSKVAVRSGETLVLGGLIKDSASSSKGGVPLLSSIPVVGALFGRHRNTADRTELLVILTPRVLRSDDDARAISRELRDRMQGLMEPLPASSRQNRP